MNTRTLCGLRVPILRVMLALLAASMLNAATTVTFQDGVNGYTGAKDISINTQYSQYNGGNGTRNGAATRSWAATPQPGLIPTRSGMS